MQTVECVGKERVVYEIPRLTDDGLLTPEVAGYAERKYLLIRTMAEIVATGMKDRWNSRVYLDLYAGAGRSRIRRPPKIIPSSGMLALSSLPHPFDRYVFCDQNQECLDAFAKRAGTTSSASARFLTMDVNADVHRILAELPPASRSNTVLTMCVVDPFNMSDFRFSTIETLAGQRIIDFLVLIPSYMEAHRNQEAYCRPDHTVLEHFFGDPAWRDAWATWRDDARRKGHPQAFGQFVAGHFGERMRSLGFTKNTRVTDMELIDYAPKNVRLYHLAYFSKNAMAETFWRQARKYSKRQKELFD